MTSAWQRRERLRAEKLKHVEEQVESGSLVIRPMTPAEREANPPRPPREKPRERRR
jgi:hypothetical protein